MSGPLPADSVGTARAGSQYPRRSGFGPSWQTERHRCYEQVHLPIAEKRKETRDSVSLLPPNFETFATTHLIIESTLLVEEIKEFYIRLVPPEVEITDFEITPDCHQHVHQDHKNSEKI